MNNESDIRGLVDRAKSRDKEAFGQLYDLFYDKIFQFIYYRISNYHEAEDITEQVFLNAIQNLKRFEWRGAPFSSWLFRIAANQVTDYFRSNRYEIVDIDNYSEIPSLQHGPDEQVLSAMGRDELLESIKKLTEQQQVVLILKYMIGMSTDEIAAVIKKRAGAVRALQHRALISLGKIVNGKHYENEA